MISVLAVGGVTSSCTSSLPEASEVNAVDVTVLANDELALEKQKSQENTTDRGAVSEMPIERVFELQQMGSILLIDTRPPIFYKLGHIDGAHSLPLKSFEKSFVASKSIIDDAKSAGKKIVIYCQSEKCQSSDKMAQRFSERGYNVSIFKGGWELWKMSGL